MTRIPGTGCPGSCTNRGLSGDLPGPGEVLSRRPDLADDPQWAIYLIGSNDGDIGVSATGLTLAEAREIGADAE